MTRDDRIEVTEANLGSLLVLAMEEARQIARGEAQAIRRERHTPRHASKKPRR